MVGDLLENTMLCATPSEQWCVVDMKHQNETSIILWGGGGSNIHRPT